MESRFNQIPHTFQDPVIPSDLSFTPLLTIHLHLTATVIQLSFSTQPLEAILQSLEEFSGKCKVIFPFVHALSLALFGFYSRLKNYST